jgi:hypothetical protein
MIMSRLAGELSSRGVLVNGGKSGLGQALPEAAHVSCEAMFGGNVAILPIRPGKRVPDERAA